MHTQALLILMHDDEQTDKQADRRTGNYLPGRVMQRGQHGGGRADEHRVLPGPQELGARCGAGRAGQHHRLPQQVQVRLGQAVVLQDNRCNTLLARTGAGAGQSTPQNGGAKKGQCHQPQVRVQAGGT